MFTLVELGLKKDSYKNTWTTDLQELQSAVAKADKAEQERQAKMAKILHGRWEKLKGKTKLDEEAKNLSSVMFEYDLPAAAHRPGSNGKMLLTGDSTGEILYSALKDAGITIPTDGSAPRRYRIMKVMHHGSSRNCWLRDGPFTAGKSGDGIRLGCYNFFLAFSADIYCISGDSFDKNPNPDNFVLEAICRAHVYRGESGPVIAVTNTLSFAQCYNMMRDWSAGHTHAKVPHVARPQIFTLDRECDYGSIYPDLRDKYVFSPSWGSTNSVDSTDMIPHTVPTSLLRKRMDVGLTTFEKTTLPSLSGQAHWYEFKDEMKNNDAPDPQGPHRERPMGRDGVVRRKRKRDTASLFVSSVALPSVDMKPPEVFFTLATTSSQGMVGTMASATPVPTTKPQHVDWHDLMTSNLVSVGLFEMGDFQDSPIQPAVEYSNIEQTKRNYSQWVDMRSLVLLIEEYNSGLPVGRHKRIPLEDIQRFKAWFGNVTADSNPAETPVVAMFFLAQFLSRDAIMKLYAQLPINHHGRLEDELSFTTSSSSSIAAIMALTIQNFRARVILPTPAEHAAGENILIVAFHFELAPPLPGWTPQVQSGDVMQWSIPLDNSEWERGQIRLKHYKNLRVKILYPQYDSAITFVYFRSLLTVYADPLGVTKRAEFEVEGKMVTKGGEKEVASYDILLKGEREDGKVMLLDLVRLWSPAGEAATLARVLAGAMEGMDVPGVDLPDLLHDALLVQNCGIILRQFTPWGTGVGLHDVYGTIDIGEKLGLADEAFGIPGFPKESIPLIPDLTITLSDVMLDDIKLSFAFGFSLPDDLGFAAVQIGTGADENPRFDFWLVTEPDTNLFALLSHLGLDDVFQDLDKGAIFTDALALVSVPLTQITVSSVGSKPRTSSSKYGIEKCAFMVEVDTFHIPNKVDAVITMENIQLIFERQNPSQVGGTPTVKVFGQATMMIGDVEAELIFAADPGRRKAEAFLSDKMEEFQALGPSQNHILLQITFPGKTPSFGDILSHLVGDIGVVQDITDVVPSLIKEVFMEVLNFVEYREITVEVSKTSTTPQKWKIGEITISVMLGRDVVKKLNDALDGIISFEAPSLTVTILNPADKMTREWNVFISGYGVLVGTLVEIQASFFKPPEGLKNMPTGFGLTIECGVTGGPGVPVGEILLDLAGAAISQSTITVAVPETLRDIVESVEVSAIRLSFTEDLATRKYKVKWLEAVINVARDETLVIVDDYAISDILLHITHSTGVGMGSVLNPNGAVAPAVKNTTITLDGKLKLGPKHTLTTAISHSTSTGAWSMSVTDSNADGIDIVDLALSSLPSIPSFTLPSEFDHQIRTALKINISSFYISYSPIKPNQPQRLIFSQDGELSLFGIGSKSLRLILERSPPRTWDWTLAVQLPSPCFLFKGIFGDADLLGLNGVPILNGYISVSSGVPSSVVSAIPYIVPTGPKEVSLSLSGKIELKNSAAFKLIADIVKVDEVSFMVAVPKLVLEISIPAGDEEGLRVMEIFTMRDFRLRLETPGKMALGVAFTMDVSWFSRKSVTAAMFITFEPTAIGAIFNMGDIEAPFGMEFLYMENTHFTLAWLVSGVGPKSLAIKAGVKIKPPRTSEAMNIEASFDCGLDATNPAANYFSLRAKHITLKDVVMALMAARSLPSPLDSEHLNIGFGDLEVDIIPMSLQYSIEAKFFFFFLRGQIFASATITGFKFASMLDKIDILGLIQVTSAHNTNIGPFCYLDVTANSLISGKGDPPKWLDAVTATDPNLQGAIFALTGQLVFLGESIKAYGYVSNKGLHLAAMITRNISPISAISIRAGAEMEIITDSHKFFGHVMLHLSIDISLAKLDVLGTGLGGLDVEFLALDAGMTIQVLYGDGEFYERGLVYIVQVRVEIFGLDTIDGDVKLSLSVKELEDIPDVVKGFIEDEIVDALEHKIWDPIKDVVEDIGDGFEVIGDESLDDVTRAIDTIHTAFNLGSHELIHLLLSAGYSLPTITHILKDTLNLTISEIASGFVSFGEDVTKIAHVIGDAFEAFPYEVATGLIAAGIAIEDAFEAVFDEIGRGVAGGVSLIGNSIVGFGEEAVQVVAEFFGEDVKEFFEDVGEAFIDGVTDVLEDIGDWFEETCVVG